jgi:hypothetical protein
MKRALLVLAVMVCFVAVGPALAQNPNYDVGPVWRVTYYHIKPGMGDAFWKDIRENLRPIYEEAKKQGYFSDYKFFTNATNNGPNDWDVAIAVLYPNWAALDSVDTKAAPIVNKHYGSREASLEAAKKRAEFREVVASHLAREALLK